MFENKNKGFAFRRYDCINMALAVIMIFAAFISLVDSLFGRNAIYIISQFIYLFFILNAIPAILKNFPKYAYVLCFIVTWVFIVSSLFSANQQVFVDAQRTILLWSFPYFLLGACVTDFKNLLLWLRRASLIILIISIIELLVVYTSASFKYSQELGYGVLPTLTLYSMSFIRNRNLFYIIPICISFLVILASGARGPLLCAILFFILFYIINYGISKKIIMVGVVLFSLYFAFSGTFYKLLKESVSLFTNNNFSTRTVELLLSGEIGTDNERQQLRNIAKEYIWQHPIIGSGVLNDRMIIAQELRQPSERIYGLYCHNFFLEIMMQFGLFPGLLILSVFFYKLFKIIRDKQRYITIILVFAISIGLFPLLVSRSWITFSQFYLLVGIIISYGNIKKKYGSINQT